MSERTEALMLNTPIKAQQIALEELTDEMRATRPGFEWKLDLERARLLTESYKQTENEPMTVRRAKALAHILDNMTIYIRSDEMIVGNYACDNDSEEHIQAVATLLAKMPGVEKISLLDYHEWGKPKYGFLGIDYPFEGEPSEDQERLERLKGIMVAAGLTVTIGH